FSGSRVVGHWLTPIVWTGYVLLVDALVARATGRSYLTTHRLEGVLVALVSIGSWWLFEWYNAPRFWRGGPALWGLWWQSHAGEPTFFLPRGGYAWAFAPLFPAMFLTAAGLRASMRAGVRVRPWRASPRWCRLGVITGAVFAIVPLVIVSAWMVPLVWTSFVLLLQPLNPPARP